MRASVWDVVFGGTPKKKKRRRQREKGKDHGETQLAVAIFGS